MTHVRRWLFLGLVLLGTQLSAGCYLGLTSRPVLFPNVALTPAIPRPAGVGCGPACYREFGGPSLLSGPAVTGPVYDAAPMGYGGMPAGYGGGYSTPTPGCAGCSSSQYPMSGVPIAGTFGGPLIAGTPGTLVPTGAVPFDSGTVTFPTVKPPAGSIPLQMPSEVKESKKIVAAGK